MEKFHKRKKTITLAGVSMARVLTDSDTEAMIQRVQPEERDEVDVLFLLSLSFCFFSFYSTLFDCFVDINQHVCSLAALPTFLFYSFCSGQRPS